MTQLAIEIRIRCEIKAISDNHLHSVYPSFPQPFSLNILSHIDKNIPCHTVVGRQDDTLSENLYNDDDGREENRK
jgi:kynurenine formamidase